MRIDDLVKSLKRRISVIPAKAGIQLFQILNIYIRKVEKVGGELQNTVVYTYPNVSQFWKYKPEEFLKQPVYSREYPPLKP